MTLFQLFSFSGLYQGISDQTQTSGLNIHSEFLSSHIIVPTPPMKPASCAVALMTQLYMLWMLLLFLFPDPSIDLSYPGGRLVYAVDAMTMTAAGASVLLVIVNLGQVFGCGLPAWTRDWIRATDAFQQAMIQVFLCTTVMTSLFGFILRCSYASSCFAFGESFVNIFSTLWGIVLFVSLIVSILSAAVYMIHVRCRDRFGPNSHTAYSVEV
jgi:membrane-anchored glycerophosphoryl diester phosphodiesterase (GDPDase)